MAASPQDSGHRLEPHTADVVLCAWSPTEAGCLAQAVEGLTASFVAAAAATPTGTRVLRVRAATAPERLVAVLEEVLFLLDTEGVVPVAARIEPVTGPEVRGELAVVAVAATVQVGSVPKGIARHELRQDHSARQWQCRVVVDV
jgi:SHS2 domain-containing protein